MSAPDFRGLPVPPALLLEEAGQRPGHASGGWRGTRQKSGWGPERSGSEPAMMRSVLHDRQHITKTCEWLLQQWRSSVFQSWQEWYRIYIWRSIVCVCVFLWVCHFPVLARGARGRRLLIACLVLNKQEIAVNLNKILFIVKKFTNENREIQTTGYLPCNIFEND